MKKIFFFICLIIISVCLFLFVFNNKSSENEEPSNLNIATIISTNNSTNVENSTENNIDFSSLNYLNSLKTYTISPITSNNFITTSFSNEKLEISINDSAIDILLFEDMKAKANTTYEVSNITGNIHSVFSGKIGNSVSYPVLLVVFEDGSVESINTELGFKNGIFESAGKVDSLSNIEKIVNVNITENNSTYPGMVAVFKDNTLLEITLEMLP